MFRRYLERGLAAGAVGGLAFGLFVAVVGNPLVRAVESLGHHHAAHGGHESAVSATVTNVVSVGGGVLWGLLLGGVVFGALYYFLEPAIPGDGATKRYVLAAAGFVTASGAPWLVVPPKPPGVESTVAVGTQQLLYGGMVLAGALACMLAGYAYDRLRGRGVRWQFAAVGALAPFALLAVPALAFSVPTTGDVPAAMTVAYRGFVVFGQATLWFVLASAHAWLGDARSPAATDEFAPDGATYPSD